ncbi:DnaJ domain-containing protein [Methylocapsa polymorpha]|uniref:DnaJ domain-containing protein n=1 Tax=Methylocapsa polymorpha TaxID=3080828 RepID=A0ABZ0HSI9_9HYPH|nr:DnaJ domain-containing protein [Methylocapsa sp. RX1]
MNLNSRIFDRIRVKPEQKQAPRPDQARCEHPGCSEPGEFRAPMGRLREGQYFCFCLDHVREYNASYNYFNGMSADDVALYQRDAVVGHRPTWSMGVKRGGKNFREEGDDPSHPGDTLGMVHAKTRRYSCVEPTKPRYGLAALKALDQLGLDDTADAVAIKARYKNLVKRLHPDANSGDRSNEDRLREIIRAYNYLKSVKPA